jgi:hypothetical protein
MGLYKWMKLGSDGYKKFKVVVPFAAHKMGEILPSHRDVDGRWWLALKKENEETSYQVLLDFVEDNLRDITEGEGVGRWVPTIGDDYWTTPGSSGQPMRCKWIGDNTDIIRLVSRKVFKTEQECLNDIDKKVIAANDVKFKPECE